MITPQLYMYNKYKRMKLNHQSGFCRSFSWYTHVCTHACTHTHPPPPPPPPPPPHHVEHWTNQSIVWKDEFFRLILKAGGYGGQWKREFQVCAAENVRGLAQDCYTIGHKSWRRPVQPGSNRSLEIHRSKIVPCLQVSFFSTKSH